MRYVDICSGISAPTMAWKPLGWDPLLFAEIDNAPRAVLQHRYPEVPLYGDFTEIQRVDKRPDLLVGGTPCQDFSIAGLRAGLAGNRGNLTLEFFRLADRLRPRWIVWENVHGVLSHHGGRTFGTILGALAQLGYGWSYRVLDAQYCGVPQRRRRVFVVGYIGDWRRAAAVLFERHSLSGHPAPRREKGPVVAALTADGVGTCGADDNPGQAGHLIPQGYGGDIAPTLNAAFGSKLGLDNQHIDSGAGLFVAHSLRGEGFDASEDGTGRGTPLVPVSFTGGATDILNLENCAHPVTGRNGDPGMVCFSAKDYGADASDISPTLRAGGHSGSHANAGVMPAIAFDTTQITHKKNRSNPQPGGPCHPLAASAHPPAITGSAVRRLTPRECERLQGFPDDFTLVPYRKGMMADGPRYKMLGNSMAVPVVRWIGERIALVDEL